MRDRVKDYHIYATNSQVVVRLLTLPNDVVLEEVEGELTPVSTRRVIEAIRLIVDETIGEVFCSSMQKNKIRKVYGSGTSMGVTAACAIEFAQPEGKTANTTDQFTIELDWGDVTAKETTLNSAKEEILTAVDNIKLPEIDTTELAKQGENKNATNSKIYDAVKGIPDLSLLYSARFEKNDDGEDTYSMVLPIVAGVIANEDGETVTIKL